MAIFSIVDSSIPINDGSLVLSLVHDQNINSNKDPENGFLLMECIKSNKKPAIYTYYIDVNTYTQNVVFIKKIYSDIKSFYADMKDKNCCARSFSFCADYNTVDEKISLLGSDAQKNPEEFISGKKLSYYSINASNSYIKKTPFDWARSIMLEHVSQDKTTLPAFPYTFKTNADTANVGDFKPKSHTNTCTIF